MSSLALPCLETLDVGIATFLASMLILTAWHTSSDLQSGQQWRQRICSIAYVSLLLGLSGLLATNGFLRDFSSRPPRIALLMLPITVSTISVGLSPLGRRLASLVPLWGLVGFQSFRVLVEVLLWGLYRSASLPIQMTFEGYNFDVLTGLSAIALAWGIRTRRVSTRLLWIWNLCGLALLINIVTIAVLSMPGPLRVFSRGPPNIIVTWLPFVWIPCAMVQAALFGHILVFRALWMGAGAARPIQSSPIDTKA